MKKEIKSKELNQWFLDAVDNNKIEAINLLIDMGADVNAKNKLGNTALHWAVKNGRTEIVKLLKDAGATE